MLRSILVFLFFSIAMQMGISQNMWQTLSKITFKQEMDELLGFKVDVPVFSKEIEAYDEKEIELQGYIIPVQGYKSHTEFVFSAFPYNMCFFCGGAGPETVAEIYSKEPIKYTAKQVKIKGILHLNNTDVNKLMYIVTDAELVEE